MPQCRERFKVSRSAISQRCKGMRRITRKSGWGSLLILGLLFLRGLIPAGFMLAPVDGNLALVLCSLDLPVAAVPAGAMPASHPHMHEAQDHSAHQHGAHGDPTCPYAQSGGPAPLPTLPVLAGGTTFERPILPAAVTQTRLRFGPIRQPSSRGPPHLA
jgi:hypothetical protein